jgi:cbb3-type cytochrome oxidase subunit 3
MFSKEQNILLFVLIIIIVCVIFSMSYKKDKENFDDANYINLFNKINSDSELKQLLLENINTQINIHNVNKLNFKDKLDKIENKITKI